MVFWFPNCGIFISISYWIYHFVTIVMLKTFELSWNFSVIYYKSAGTDLRRKWKVCQGKKGLSFGNTLIWQASAVFLRIKPQELLSPRQHCHWIWSSLRSFSKMKYRHKFSLIESQIILLLQKMQFKVCKID